MMRCRKTARPEVCSGYADWEKVDPLTRTGPRPVCGSVYGTAARWRTKSGRFSTPQLTAEARSCAMAGGTSQTFIATSGNCHCQALCESRPSRPRHPGQHDRGTGTGAAAGTPRGWGQCLRFHRDGGQYGVPVGTESTTHGTAACAAALAHPLYGANVLLKIVTTMHTYDNIIIISNCVVHRALVCHISHLDFKN